MFDEEAAAKRAWQIRKFSQTEAEYREMLIQIRNMEKAYEEALEVLPQTQENAVRDFVAQWEAMSWRVLLMACALMVFPDTGNN